MKVIYIDSLFLLNFILDYLLLLAAGRICALPLRRLRYALGAALGAPMPLPWCCRPWPS